VRRYWVYVPVGYDAARPPNLLVFQDGQRATNPGGALRVPAVLDNLIADGAIPPTLAVFVTPGNLSEHYPDDLDMGNPDHRAPEYDALDDTYVRMLSEELLPEVARRWRFAEEPARRAIGGTSSGAIAAFTAAWHRPDAFGNVISFIGSYTSIGYSPATTVAPMVPGGDLYPTLIRKSPIRPIRMFLQDGSHDLDNEHGNWFLANQQMLAALEWANAHADEAGDAGPRYVVRHEWGDGTHSDAHGGMLLPEVLRWIWGGGE
jgi:enterochelin esterase family protein